jgi:hypothetical protein
MNGRALALALLAGACGVPGEGPMMEPGRDCMECHGAGDAPGFSAAGTVFGRADDPVDAGVMNVRVELVGADGRVVAVRTNRAGNFYTRERIAFPARVRIEKDGVVRVMSDPAPDGACNRCHDVPAPREGNALGRIGLVGG